MKLNEMLLFYATVGDLEKVEAALILGADVNAMDNDGQTALYKASRWNHPKIVKILLRHGADVNVKDNDYGWTALHEASNPEIAKSLLASGIDVNAKENKDGETALHFASRCGHSERVKILLEYNADVYVKDNYGRTPLDVASHYDRLEIKEILEKSLEKPKVSIELTEAQLKKVKKILGEI